MPKYLPGAQKRAYFDLLLISFVILFFELACIRWFGAMVIFLTFFTNIVLMACFLGMSVGCLAASRKQDFINIVIPMALISTALACIVLKSYGMFDQFAVNVGNQSSAKLIYFGTEYRTLDPSRWFIPIWVISGIFFTLISILFVGLGQVMGRAFDTISNRIAAYSINITGSLLGIGVFFLMSLFNVPPYIWFGICIFTCLYFIRQRTPLQIIGAVLVLFFVSLGAFRFSHSKNVKEIWSPYYKISYAIDNGEISTNNIQHQSMTPIHTAAPAYSLPYLLSRDAGRKSFEDVLIIGAGTGNDVAAALAFGDKRMRVDAVEIDPVILSIGKSAHPDRPYNDPRVTLYMDDGRSFLKKNPEKKYDLIVYALVDSLVLHSGYSSLRLESFLFTDEAFQDVKNRLKPDGMFAMYNYYRQGWVIGRLAKMVKNIFETDPIVFSIPYQDKIDIFSRTDFFTLLLVGKKEANKTVQDIQTNFRNNVSFWVNEIPENNYDINAYYPTPPGLLGKDVGQWLRIGPAKLNTEDITFTPNDNWPFLYLRDRIIPFSPSIEGMIMIAIISLFILFLFAPSKINRINGQMFFLGAGFMLLETKGVVHMALLFGSTWLVNSVVFAAILVMILLANLFVTTKNPQTPKPYYYVLFSALLMNMFVPITYFLSLPDNIRTLVSCVIIFIPIFFAGVIFAMAFKKSSAPEIDIGSNIGGVIAGGLSEYFSLIIGFNHLLGIGIIFYILSMMISAKQ